MTSHSKYQTYQIVFYAMLIAIPVLSQAEVTLDGSLGGTLNQAILPGNGFTYDIDESVGATRGSNLFHSFDQFNINVGEHANFSGAASIQNIIARITGGQSSIAGKVTSSIDSSALWLVNPAGFMFSNGAVVDVGGSFNLSTTDFLQFADGARFFSRLSATSTLSSAEITGFGFLGPGLGRISIDSSRAIPGEDRSVGHNLNVNSAFILIENSNIQAQEIGIRMGDAAFGQIDINSSILESVGGGIFFQGGNIFSVDSTIIASGKDSEVDIAATSLTLEGQLQQSVIRSGNLQASGGGINITARDITLTNNAALISTSGGGLRGGDITLQGETILIDNNSRLDLAAGKNTVSGDLIIRTQDILIRNNSSLNTSSRFDGATAGSIDIIASGRFGIEGNSVLLAESESTGIGGGVVVTANTIVIRDASSINVNSLGEGDANLVDLNAITTLTIDEKSNISAASNSGGNGGIVQLRGQTVILDDMSIQGSANGSGTGGNILIEASNINITNGTVINVSSFASTENAGDAGRIDIRGDNINISGGTQFRLTTAGGGVGGTMRVSGAEIRLSDVRIEAEAKGSGDGGEVSFQGTSINWTRVTADLSVDGTGTGGFIRLDGAIQIEDSTINITARGAGDAGDLVATGSSFLMLGSGGIFGDTRGSGTGAGVLISSGVVQLEDIRMTSGTRGSGTGGEILINSATSITLVNATLNSQSDGTGVGGDIDLITNQLTLAGTASINVSAFGSANAGDIDITASDLRLTDSSRFVLSATGTGQGGLLTVNATTVTLSDQSQIQASVSFGAEGDLVRFNTTNFIMQHNSKIISDTRGSGSGGTIDINTKTFTLSDNASLNAEAVSRPGGPSGTGDAGLIMISGPMQGPADSVILNGGSIITNTTSEGEGGSLIIDALQVSISNGSKIKSDSLSPGDGGDLRINAVDLTISNAALTAESRGSGIGGEINLIITGSLSLTDGALINVSAFSSPGEAIATGEAGLININADNISIENSTIALSTFTIGNAGTLNITAQNFSLINSRILGETFDAGEGSDITFNVNQLSLIQSDINSATHGSGEAGEIMIRSRDVSITNNSNIVLATTAAGAGGTLTIEADTLSLVDSTIKGDTSDTGLGSEIRLTVGDMSFVNSSIDSATRGTNRGGLIRFTGDKLVIDNSRINAETAGSGDGGAIIINVDNVLLSGRGELNAKSSRFGPNKMQTTSGNAGNISITSSHYVMNSGIILLVTETDGEGGALTITSDTIQLKGGATLTASALGNGDAGSISLLGDHILLDESSKITSDTTGSGIGGDIKIAANQLYILNGSTVSSSAAGSADAGSIHLDIENRLEIVEATVQTTSDRSGGGNILIETEEFIRIDQGVVSASANGLAQDSDGGNVTIDPVLFIVRQSQIVAQANAGSGGNITLAAINFIADTETLISASSQKGIDGSVEIESPNQAANPVSVDLNTGFQDLPDFVSNNCTAPALNDRSYLLVDNQNAVKRDPNDYLSVGSE